MRSRRMRANHFHAARKKPRSERRAHPRRRMAPERLEERTLLATIVWDGEAGDLAWSNPANWFDETGGVNNASPRPGDDVQIRSEFSGQTISLLGTAASVRSLQSAAGLHIESTGHAAAGLLVAGSARVDGALHLVSGALGGGGTWTITDTLQWTGGTLEGGGTLEIAPSGRWVISSGGSLPMTEVWTVDNHGLVDWSRGGVAVHDVPFVLENRRGAVFEVRDVTRFGGGAGGRTLNNEGTLRKSAGTGRSEIQMIVNNTGLVEVQAGTLALVKGGTSSGDFSFAAGTTLELRGGDDFFQNTHAITLGAGSSIRGEGRLLVPYKTVVIQGTGSVDVPELVIEGSRAQVDFNLDVTIPKVTLATSTGGLGGLGGTGTLSVTEQMDWTGGSMLGGGTTSIVRGATLTIDAASADLQDGGRTIVNDGTIEWIRGNVSNSRANPLTLHNRAGALIDIRSSAAIGAYGSVLNNAGTVRKSAGTGRSDLRLAVDNTGTVEVQAGTLALSGGGTSSGSFSFAAGTTLELRQGDPPPFSGLPAFPHTITLGESEAISGAGRLLVVGDNTTIGGSGRLDTQLLEVSTSAFADLFLNLDASVPVVNLASGRLGGKGTLTVTESMNWTGGDMADGGATVIASGAMLTIDAAHGVAINDGDSGALPTRTIDNFGTMRWLRGDIFLADPLLLRNRAGAVLDVRADATLGHRGTLINDGTFRKTAGSGTAVIDVAVDNQGAIEVHQGTLRLVRPVGNFSSAESAIVGGSWLVSTAAAPASAATLRLDGVSPFQNNGANIRLDGEGAGLVNQSSIDLLGALRRIDSGASLSLVNGRDLALSPGNFENLGELALGAGSTLSISGDLTLPAEALLTITLGGETASGLFGNVAAGGTAHLGGTLRIERAAGFEPPPGESYEIMAFTARDGGFAAYEGLAVEGEQALEVRETADRVFVEALPSGADAEALRAEFNAGIAALAAALPEWGQLLNLASIDLPVSVEALDTLLGLSGSGALSQVAASRLVPADQPAGTLDELAAQIAALEGFSILAVNGDPGTMPEDLLLARFSHVVTGIERTAGMDEAASQLVDQLAEAADLEGTLNYTADVQVDVVLGLDAEGFFVRGDSTLGVDLLIGGSAATTYDLQIPGLRVVSLPQSGAAADLNVALTGSGPGQRLRAGDLADPLSFLSPTADGVAEVALELNLEVLGAASDLQFSADWTVPIVQGQTGDVDAQFDYPPLEDLFHALLPVVQEGFPALFAAEWSDLLDTVPMPLTEADDDGAAQEPEGWWPAFLDATGDLFSDIDLDGLTRGLALLAELVTIETTLGADQVADLLAGSLPEGAELLRARFIADAASVPPLGKTFGFGFSTGELGSLGSAALSGEVAAQLRPAAEVGFGIDTSGFFITADSRIGGEISGEASAEGMLNDFVVQLRGMFGLAPVVSFASSADPKIHLSELPARLAEDLRLMAGTVSGTASADLVIGLLDYLDVDGDATNNTIHGGDAFVVRGTATVAADLDSLNATELAAFRYDFSSLELLNGDIDEDGEEDFTPAALGGNAIALAKDIVRGDRSVFGLDLAAAFDAVAAPLTSSPLGQALGVGDALRWLADGSSEGEADGKETPPAGDVFEVLHTTDFALFASLLNDGVPVTPAEIGRFRVHLDHVGLEFIDDALTFDLSTVLPETANIDGRAAIENAQLSGALVFGLDTSANPLYLLTAADALTPGHVTTLGGAFEVVVDVSGEPLGSGLLTLNGAEARMSPQIALGFAELGIDKLRIGPELALLRNTSIALSGHTVLNVAAAGASLTPGALAVAIEDDDPADGVPAVRAAIEVATGSIQGEFGRATAGIDGLQIAATRGTFQLGLNMAPDATVFMSETAALALPFEGSGAAMAARDLLIRGDGEASIASAELLAGDGLASAFGLAGLLPFDVTRVEISRPDEDGDGQPERVSLSDFNSDITVEGFFDFSAYEQVGFRPSVSIGGAAQPEGSANPLAITFRLVDGAIAPWNTGEITLGLESAELFPGFALDGSLTLGGYTSGVWNPSIAGSLSATLVLSEQTHSGLTVNILPGSTLDAATGTLSVAGEVLFDLGIGGTFGGVALAGGRLPFSLALEVDRTDEPPFFTVQQPIVTFGELAIDRLVIDAAGVFILTASEITINAAAGPDDPIAAIGRLEIDVPALDGLEAEALAGGGNLPGVALYRDRLELVDVRFTLHGLLEAGGRELMALDELFVAFDSVTIPFPGIGDLLATPTEAITLTDLAPLVDPADPVGLKGISFGFEAAVLLPEPGADVPEVELDDQGLPIEPLESEGIGAALAVGALGSIDAGGTLRLEVAHIAAAPADLFSISASGAVLVITGPGVQSTEPLLSVAVATLAVPLADSLELNLQAVGLAVDRDGSVSIMSASATPVAPATTIGETLGLAEFLPVDLTGVLIDGGGTPILLSNPDFDLTVAGVLNLGLFDGLPFEPFVRIGEGDLATVFDEPSSTIELTFHVDATPAANEPPITITTAGPFFLGFREFSIGDLTFDGLIALGEVVDSRFTGELGGLVRLRGGDLNEDPLALDIELAVAGQILSETLPDGAVVTTLSADFTGIGSGKIGDVLTVEEAQFHLNMALQNRATSEQPFQFSAIGLPGEVEPYPVFRVNAVNSGLVSIALGDFVTLSGQAAINFAAPEGQPLLVLHEAAAILDEALGPAAGLGLRAGGFGLGADGTVFLMADDSSTPENEGAHIELLLPADGARFGLPSWLPLTIHSVALMFNGIDADGDGLADDGDGDGNPDPYDISAGGGFSQFAPLVDPDNFSLLISGGLSSIPDFWPIVAQVERLAVDVGILADNVRAAAEHFGLTDSEGNPQFDQIEPWQLFAVPPQEGLEFPITNIDAVNFGIAPIDFGAFQAGAGLGFGMLTVEREEGAAERVFFARVEGELGLSKIGLGAELIVTQFGPVLGRIFAGVPIPVGALIGSVGGPIGTGAGAATGFLITGLEGGIVFGGEPLPVVQEPTDIFSAPEIRHPLTVGLEEIRSVVAPLIEQNPTLSEVVQGLSQLGLEDFSLANIVDAYLTGDLPGLDFHFTWEDGFRLAATGVLTNQYVSGMIGAGVTLGANFGYDLDELFDIHGNPLAAASEVGVQLYGIADLEVLGQKLIGAGILLDYSDILNPVINIAASLPGAPGSLLSLLLPAQGNIGLSLDSQGLNEGSLVAAITFFQQLSQPIGSAAGALFSEVLDRMADGYEASRRAALGLSLDGLVLAGDFEPDANDPLWRILLDLDGDGVISAGEQRTISADFLLARLVGGGSEAPAVEAIFPGLSALDFGAMTAAIDPLAELQFGLFDPGRMTDLLLLGFRLLGDATRSGMAVFSDPGGPEPAGLDAELPVLPAAIALVNETFDRMMAGESAEVVARLNAARGRAIDSARVSLALMKLVAEASDAAKEKFFETIDPQLRIVGVLQPVILGIPLGPPKEEVDVRISKSELTIRARVGLIEKLLAVSPIPLPITSEELIDIHLPFENLLLDLANARLPRLDPLGADWRVGLGSSLAVFGLEIGQAVGYVFPPGARELLIDGDTPLLQIYHPADPSPERLDPTRILVDQQYEDRLIREGGLLVDGRLTLPRFITDPLALFAEIEEQAAGLLGDHPDVLSAILADPSAAFVLLTSLPGQISAIEEVAQLQLFVPNFVDDVVAGIDAAQLAALTDPQLVASNGGLAQAIETALAERVELVAGLLSDPDLGLYLRGSYGQLPALYAAEAFTPVKFPTTSKLLGIDMGGAQITGDSEHLEILGTFLGVAGARFLIDANRAFPSEFGLPRIAAEMMFGPGTAATHAPGELENLLAALGFDPAALAWLALPADADVSGSLRAYSPGFEIPAAAASVEPIKQTGGIEAQARLVLPGLVDLLETSFSIKPSGTLVPDVSATANIEDLSIGGLAGLPSTVFDADLDLSFNNSGVLTEEAVIQAAIGGDVAFAGQELSAAGQLVLDATQGAYGFVQLGQAGGAFDLGAFDFAGTATLLVNATGQARTFDLPGSSEAEDPELRPFSGSVLLDGTLTLAGATMDGRFQLSAGADGLLVQGAGTLEAFGFDVTGAFRFMVTPAAEVALEVAGQLVFLGNTLQVGGVAEFDASEGFVGQFELDTAGAAFGFGGFNIAVDTLALSIDTTQAGAAARVVLGGELSIAGMGSVSLAGNIGSDTMGTLVVGGSQIFLGGPASSLVIGGTLQLSRQVETVLGRPTIVTSFGGSDIDLRWTPFNQFNSGLHFNVPEFRVSSAGQILVAVEPLTFGLGGTTGTRMRLATGPMTLDVDPAAGRFDLELASAELEVPGIFPASNRLSLPAFSLSTAPTFSATRDLNFSLGPFTVTGGRLDFRRTTAGVTELEVGPRGGGVPLRFVLPGVADVNLAAFSIDTLGRFELDAAAPQIGPASLHIENARLIVDKNTSSFSVALTGGKLDLPVGPTIDLPSLSFSTFTGALLDRTLWLTPAELVFGSYFQRQDGHSNRQFRLAVSGGVLRLEQTSSAFAMQALPGSSLAMSNLVIAGDGTFQADVSGQLGAGDFTIASADLELSRLGNVLHVALAEPATVDLGFMSVEVDGYFRSDGTYNFSGAVGGFSTPFGQAFSLQVAIDNSGFSATAVAAGVPIGSVSRAGRVTLLGGLAFALPGGSNLPALSITNNPSVIEGNHSTTDIDFVLEISHPPLSGTIGVEVEFQSDTSVPLAERALLGSDVSTAYSKTFYFDYADDTPAERRRTVRLRALHDLAVESDERFKLVIKKVTAGGIIADRVSVATILNDDQLPLFMTYPAVAMNGYMDGATVLLDADRNGMADFLDLNGDGLQGAGEPNEPTATTAADGSVLLAVPVEFDRNGDGRIGPDEATLVVSGGLDTGSLVPLATTMSAPGGSQVATPLTTLAVRMNRAFGLSAADAGEVIRNHFGLPGEVDLFGLDAIAASMAGDQNGSKVEAAVIQVHNTAVQITRLLAGAGLASPADAAMTAFDAIGERLLTENVTDFKEAAAIEAIIEGAAARLGTALSTGQVLAAAAVIVEGNRRIAEVPLAAGLSYVRSLKAIQAVALLAVADDLALLGAGELAAEVLLERHTGGAFDEQVALAQVGTMVPPAVSIVDAQPLPISRTALSIQQFPILLSGPAVLPVTVQYQTFAATSEEAWLDPVAGSITFIPGQVEQTIKIPIDMGRVPGQDALYFVRLTSSEHAVLGQAVATGQFDGPPQFVVADLPAVAVPTQPVTLLAAFTDLPGQTHMAGIDWGDGTTAPVLLQQAGGGAAMELTHTYVVPGDYIAKVHVVDSLANASTVELAIAVRRWLLEPDPDDPALKVLTVGGTAGKDQIDVLAIGHGDALRPRVNSQLLGPFEAHEVSRIVVFAGDGNDHIRIDHDISLPAELRAGEGDNHVDGGRGPTWVTAGNGDDWIRTGPGNDHIQAGGGRNRIWSGGGDDLIEAGEGDDYINAGDGDDEIDPGGGSDLVLAGGGNDFIGGGAGNDLVDGGAGNDLLLGHGGHDILLAGAGHDVLIGGLGAERLSGGLGDDLIIAGTTIYDDDREPLARLAAEWQASRPFEDRVANLTAGAGPLLAGTGVHLALDATVSDDAAHDLVFAVLGEDWLLDGSIDAFFADGGDEEGLIRSDGIARLLGR